MFQLFRQLKKFLDDYDSPKQEESVIVRLMKHRLGSIDLSDVRDKVRTKEEHIAFLSQVGAFYPIVIEEEIKKMIIEQEEFMAHTVADIDAFNFSRGTINGLELLLERYKKYFEEYKELNKTEDKIDRSKLFSELE